MSMLNLANSNWESWKKTLGQAVEFAEELGISRNQIGSLAQQVGDLLAQKRRRQIRAKSRRNSGTWPTRMKDRYWQTS